MAKREYKVDRASADAEFEEWCERSDIETDEQFFDGDDVDNFNKLKMKVVRGIMRGLITFSEDGLLIYTPKNTDKVPPLKFNRRGCADLLQQDKIKTGKDVKKNYTMMCAMSGIDISMIPLLYGDDAHIPEAVFALLRD